MAGVTHLLGNGDAEDFIEGHHALENLQQAGLPEGLHPLGLGRRAQV